MPVVIDELPGATLAPSSARSASGLRGPAGAALASRDEAVRRSRDSVGDSGETPGARREGLPPLATPEPSGSSESAGSVPTNIKFGRRRWVVSPGQKAETLPDRPDSKWNQIPTLERPLAPLKAPRVRRGPPENWPYIEGEEEDLDDEDYMYRWECVRAGLIDSLPPALRKRFVKEKSDADDMLTVPNLPGAAAPASSAAGPSSSSRRPSAAGAGVGDPQQPPMSMASMDAAEPLVASAGAEPAAGTGTGTEAPGPPGVVPPTGAAGEAAAAPGSRPLTGRPAPKPEDLDPNRLAEAETVNLSYQDLGDGYQLERLRHCMQLVQNCKNLYLGDNLIKSMREFTFPNLEVLFLCRNEIASFAELPKAPRLRVLNLAGCEIGMPALESGDLAKLATVERLVLRGNPIAYTLGYRHWVAKHAHANLKFLDDEPLLRTLTEEDRLLDSEAEDLYEAEDSGSARGGDGSQTSRSGGGGLPRSGTQGSLGSVQSWGSANTYGRRRRRRRRRGRIKWLPALPARLTQGCGIM